MPCGTEPLPTIASFWISSCHCNNAQTHSWRCCRDLGESEITRDDREYCTPNCRTPTTRKLQESSQICRNMAHVGPTLTRAKRASIPPLKYSALWPHVAGRADRVKVALGPMSPIKESTEGPPPEVASLTTADVPATPPQRDTTSPLHVLVEVATVTTSDGHVSKAKHRKKTEHSKVQVTMVD